MTRSDGLRLQRGARLFCVLAIASCARAQAPPGGPPDLSGPQVIFTVPDPFAEVVAFDDAIRISFNERISERSASGTLAQAVQISPESGEIEVRHKKDGLEIKMEGGFLPDLVYRVTVLPTVQDLFRNAMPQPFEFVFSTGAEMLPNVIAGMVFDRLSGDTMEGVRVTARFQPLIVGGPGEAQGPTHVAITDSSGVFAFRYLPPVGRYVLTAFEDANRNGEADFFEPAGAGFQVLNGADTVFTDMSLLRPDTTAARITDADVVDSVTVAVQFDDYLDPAVPLDGITATLARDSLPDAIQVLQILHERDFLVRAEALEDSLRVKDSLLIAESARVADSLLAAGDSAAAVEVNEARPVLQPATSIDRREDPTRELPKRTIYMLLSDTLIAEETYEVSVAGVTNINGIIEGGGTEEFLRTAPSVDSTAIADSILAADSAAAALDDIPQDASQPDTIAPDTVPPDTILRDSVPANTTQVDRRGATLLWDSPGESVTSGIAEIVRTPAVAHRRGRFRPVRPGWS